MKLWTPEGVQTFPLRLEEARLQNIPEATNLTAEIDEQGRLMDIHRTERPEHVTAAQVGLLSTLASVRTQIEVTVQGFDSFANSVKAEPRRHGRIVSMCGSFVRGA